jgi:hypothetical protein
MRLAGRLAVHTTRFTATERCGYNDEERTVPGDAADRGRPDTPVGRGIRPYNTESAASAPLGAG